MSIKVQWSHISICLFKAQDLFISNTFYIKTFIVLCSHLSIQALVSRGLICTRVLVQWPRPRWTICFNMHCSISRYVHSKKKSSGLGLGPMFKDSQLFLGGLECTVVPKLGLRIHASCILYFICFNTPDSTNRLINKASLSPRVR